MILVMIVRDEAETIERSLDSALSVGITEAVILDTGSTDETARIINAHRINTTLVYGVWEGFAAARSEVLRYAEEKYHNRWAIMLDSGDTITELLTLGSAFNHQSWNGANALFKHDNTQFSRACIFKLDGGWMYKGVLHEFADRSDAKMFSDTIATITVGKSNGIRARDPLKYIHDADTIAKALATETDLFMCARYSFYLAQSYRDAKHAGAAIYWYERRFEVGFWEEERYICALWLGRLTGKKEWFAQAAAINAYRREAWLELGIAVPKAAPNPNWLFVELDAYK